MAVVVNWRQDKNANKGGMSEGNHEGGYGPEQTEDKRPTYLCTIRTRSPIQNELKSSFLEAASEEISTQNVQF